MSSLLNAIGVRRIEDLPPIDGFHLYGNPSIAAAKPLAFSFMSYGTVWNAALFASVNANALTIQLLGHDGNTPSAAHPVVLGYRSITADSGITVGRAVVAANSLVVSSGSTLGTVNSTPFSLWVVLFDDGGTLRLGVINCASLVSTAIRIYPLAETGLASSTAEGGAGAADSFGVFYTGTAVTNKYFRVLGYLEWASGLGTAGTWSAGPTYVQPFGPGIRLPGQIVQSVYMNTSSAFTTSNATPQTTTIAQAITPTNICNIFKVAHSGSLGSSGANKVGTVRIYRDATAIGANVGIYLSSTLNIVPCSQCCYDAPATLSSVTYSAKLASADGATNMKYPTDDLGSSPYGEMIVEEIAT